MNPYRHLLYKVEALLRQEAKLTEKERAANQWQLIIKFCGTQIIVGKGGVNTIFFQFGLDGERCVAYPDDFLEKLKSLAGQKYALIRKHKGSREKLYFSLEKALASKAFLGCSLDCLDFDGNKVAVYVAYEAMDGYVWKLSKGVK